MREKITNEKDLILRELRKKVFEAVEAFEAEGGEIRFNVPAGIDDWNDVEIEFEKDEDKHYGPGTIWC